MKVRRNHDKNPDFVSHGTYKYTRVSESKRRKKENAEKSKKNLDVSGIEPETFYRHESGIRCLVRSKRDTTTPHALIG